MKSHHTGQSITLMNDTTDTNLLTTGPLLTVKELAWEIKRHPSYVYAMRQAGFKMPGYRTTVAAALDWLDRNPDWRRRL